MREALKTLEALALELYIPPYAIARVHAGLREVDRAFAWLERGIEEHDVHLAIPPTEPKWDVLRGESAVRRLAAPVRAAVYEFLRSGGGGEGA